MANFAVAANQKTIEKANRIMDIYIREGEKKEDALVRILDLAEAEAVRGTHPELEPQLRSVDQVLSALIKGINGIVAGQDCVIEGLRKNLLDATEEKKQAMESYEALSKEATEKVMEAQAEVKKLLSDKNKVIEERDHALAIADEKTSSNTLLMQQMTSTQDALEKYRDMQTETLLLSEQLHDAENRLKDALNTIDLMKVQNELSIEKAVIEKERSMQEKISKLERENAVLQAKIDAISPKDC